jgi:hypothetical protein
MLRFIITLSQLQVNETAKLLDMMSGYLDYTFGRPDLLETTFKMIFIFTFRRRVGGRSDSNRTEANIPPH